MSERPKCDAVTNREATDTLLVKQKRCTSAQVQQDKQQLASTKAATKAQKTAITTQKKKGVATFEDQLRKEDQECDKNMACPDLEIVAGYRTRTGQARG